MATLRVPCLIIKQNGYNLFGEEIEGARKKERCGVVELARSAMHTSLRTDKTASVGAAEELLGAAVFLLGINTIASIGDTIVMDNGERFKITSKQTRYSVMGKIDHYEVGCGIGR